MHKTEIGEYHSRTQKVNTTQSELKDAKLIFEKFFKIDIAKHYFDDHFNTGDTVS